MEKLNKSIDELVNCIVNSEEYQNCISLKKRMSKNEELMQLINDVKILQKKYIKESFDEKIKQKLEEKEAELNGIPIYVVYNDNLRVVNEMLSVVKDGLNEYFHKKLNCEIEF